MDVSSSSLAMHSIELVKLAYCETDRGCNHMRYNQLTRFIYLLQWVDTARKWYFQKYIS
jgi:hypothetical protein